MKNYLIILGILLSFHVSSQDIGLSDKEKQKIKTEIQNKIDGYCNAFARMDKKWFQSFWADEELILAGDGELVKTFDAAIGKPIDQLSASYKKMIYCNLSVEDIRVMGKDAASCAVTYDWRLLMNSGDTLQSKGSWLYVFEMLNEQWKVVHSAGTHIYY